VSATIADVTRRIAAGEVTAEGLVDDAFARIATIDPHLGAFLALDERGARQTARAIDKARSANEPLGPLAGVPIALKDNLVTKDLATTAGSRILEGWLPPYDAHVVEKLRAAGAIIIGKTNLDEFGMGSSTERSAFKPTKNPWDLSLVPGGSSGGSAAAVAANLCVASLGTDTGGSIRQPASFCGVVGLKPTYGRVSRWGVIAYASSLDQVGPITKTVADAAHLLQVIAGHDPRDATSLPKAVPNFAAALEAGVDGLRIGLPREYFGEGIDPGVRAALDETIEALRANGATIVDISLPHAHLALPAYYLVAPAEASSNLARYDGVRFGKRALGVDLLDMYKRSRGAGFGPEVKRRIMLGTYALRAGYYDAYYKRAQQVRALIKRDFDEAFTRCDVIFTPVAPTPAFAFGAKANPVDMYLADVFTLSCNLAGLPGLSVPCGFTKAGLPVGAQLLGKPLDEATLLRTGAAIERWADITETPPGVATLEPKPDQGTQPS
jgi:aspartyl-tRNA(Asn)/glutamyl-tRNA(Gln) amidotransferase subunit A